MHQVLTLEELLIAAGLLPDPELDEAEVVSLMAEITASLEHPPTPPEPSDLPKTP